MRTGVTLAVLGVLAVGLALFGSSNSRSQVAAVGDTTPIGNVTGWAWGADKVGLSGTLGGVGWISFSSSNHFGDNRYGVNLDQSTGRITGSAWSDNLGWLSFDCAPNGGCFGPGETLFPDGKADSYAKVQPALDQSKPNDRNINGWARFCSVFQSGCRGNFAGDVTTIAQSTKLGGWDGWVHLGSEGSGRAYGVTLKMNNGSDASGQPKDTFHGYAWGGGDVVGWISFEGNGYGVIRGTQSLGGRCSSDVTNAIVGITPVTWTAEGYGGVGPYSYAWSESGLRQGAVAVNPNGQPYTVKDSYSRTLTVTDDSTGKSTSPIACSNSVIVQENLPYFLLSADKTSVKLDNGTTGTSDPVTIKVQPVSSTGDNTPFTADVVLRGALYKKGSPDAIAGATFTFTKDNTILGPHNGQTSEYDSGRVMTLKVTTALTPGTVYTIKVTGDGGGVSASVYPDITIGVEGTGAGFEEI